MGGLVEKERVEQTLVFCPSAVNAGGHEERGGRILRFRPDGAATVFPKAVGGPESGVVKRVRCPGAAALLAAVGAVRSCLYRSKAGALAADGSECSAQRSGHEVRVAVDRVLPVVA